MNRYNVGDLVQIKTIEEIKGLPNLGVNTIGGIQLLDGHWNTDMEKFCGLITKIGSIYSMYQSRYDLEITNDHYFSDSMLKPVFKLIGLKNLLVFDENLL